MRWSIVSYYLGQFLKIFSAITLVPVVVGKFYGESFVGLEVYLLTAFLAIVIGTIIARAGEPGRLESMEALMLAPLGWMFAVGLAAIPFMVVVGMPFIDAYFEAMSGLTTTGMSLIVDKELPRSLLFWRAFIQWIGGLGILTFFVGVIVEAGGVATRIVATEANKTDSGSMRASVFNSIKAMWYVYIVFTIAQIILLVYFEVPRFHAVTTALATLPTGGYSSVNDIGAILNTQARYVMTVFMFVGGTNFLLLYGLLQGNIKRLITDFEFRLYLGITTLVAAIIAVEATRHQGLAGMAAVEFAAFHTTALISSTGFMLQPLGEFSHLSQVVIIMAMFVGGSLGSTTGGFKMLRLGVMLKVIAQQIRSLTLPRSVLNHVVVNGRILRDKELVQIGALFFLSLSVVLTGAFLTVWLTPYSFFDSAQLMVSSVGTMGPTFLTQTELLGLPPLIKTFMMLSMLAGRLELLPLLALFNLRLLSKVR